MANLAFIGDCHLGFRHRGKVQRLRDYSKAFEEAVDKALQRKADAVVFMGDLVHHSKPDPVSLRTVLKKLMEAAQKIPVIVCIGNHEIEGHLGTTYSPIYGDVHPGIHVLTSEHPHVEISLGGRSYGFHGFEYTRSRESAEDKLKGLSQGAKADVNILCLHQAIEKYLSPCEISLSALRHAAPSYDLIVSGHVHKHQELREISDVTPTFYCGSTERISFNEAENDNGFMFFSGDGWAAAEFVHVDSAPMAYVREEFQGSAAELNTRVEKIIAANPAKLLKIEVLADLKGDIIDVRRDWTAFEDGRTVLEVSVMPKTQEAEIQLEKVELNEDLIREYFRKSGNENKEMEGLCIDLFRRYGA
ncbi:MAG: DNA repair exonuclease [Candidatus Altiarchaeota archaeon]